MYALNVFLENAPQVVLMFKDRQIAQQQELKLEKPATIVEIHDSFGGSAKISTAHVVATIIADVERDIEKECDINIIRLKKRLEAEQKFAAEVQSGIRMPALYNGAPTPSA